MAKRHARGRRTARENIADLADPGSFAEYGAFAYRECTRALEAARVFEIDDVIDPADTRTLVLATLRAGTGFSRAH